MIEDDFNLKKIYLNCRRGMLELDIILINFLKNEYMTFNKKTLKYFCLLLNESDDNLYLWLVKKQKLDYIINKDVKYIINKINNINL